MAKNKRVSGSDNRLVYSTNPDFRLQEQTGEEWSTPPPIQQKLKLRLDTRQRAGKAVTLVEGFIGKPEDLEALEKKLKTFCGTGGSVKDGVVIIQGDQRDKIMPWLVKNGYLHAKRG
jgi:translation initiation factor 1